MKHLQGLSVVLFLFWGISAIVSSHAYGDSYSDLQKQVTRQKYELEEQHFQHEMDKERAAFDESERIYEESERDLWRHEDHPEIYGQP